MWLLASRVSEFYREKGLMKLTKKVALYPIWVLYTLAYCVFAIKRVDDSSGPEGLVDMTFRRYHGLLRPFQIQSEITELVKLVQEMKPETLLEIGTASGGTLFLFSRVVPANASIISIDLPGGIHGGGYPWWKTILFRSFASKEQKITLLRADSHLEDTVNGLKKVLDGRKIDFLFIDGDHTYDGVRKDFENYSLLVRKGGMIALHDIASDHAGHGCKAHKYWNEIKPGYRHKEIISNEGQTLYGIGVIYVD
jgi:predicted O-methyltransferase YrrM